MIVFADVQGQGGWKIFILAVILYVFDPDFVHFCFLYLFQPFSKSQKNIFYAFFHKYYHGLQMQLRNKD